MMNSLISLMLSFLAQNPQSGDAGEQPVKIVFHGSISSIQLELGQLSWQERMPIATDEAGDFIQIDFPSLRVNDVDEQQKFLYLNQSSRLAGRPLASDGDSILWQNLRGQSYKIGLEYVSAISGENFQPLRRDHDRLSIKTASGLDEIATGFFTAIEDEVLEFKTELSPLRIPLSKLSSLVLMKDEPAVSNPNFLVYMTDGSVVAAEQFSLTAGEVQVIAYGGLKLNFNLTSIQKISRNNIRQLELSTDFDNCSVDGRDQYVGQVYFNRGWHQRANESISLKCLEDGLFAIWCGIDDEVLGFRQPTPLRFSVWVNGKLRAESPVKRAGDLPTLIRCELQAGDQVELKCESILLS
ncbi:MAG: NPCBM/NEW2 domain-containing protein, partial [Planctomycetota bacterium]|nr:NPCBM/NEW2 domain-containing protein [Planctomycetota bacterium]